MLHQETGQDGQPEMRSGVFVSYSHVDRDWLNRIRVHLAPYLRGEKIDLWDDKRIIPGSNWATEITAAIERARVAILLVSPDFLASNYVADVELPALLRRAGGGLTILWIPIRHAAFEVTPLGQLQATHDPSRPLATLSKAKQDEALVAISRRVVSAVELNAVANAFRIIDDFGPQADAFVSGTPEPETPPVYSVRAEQVETSINLVTHGQSQELITAVDLEKLDSNSIKLIRAFERVMKELFERWIELKPKRYAQDPDIRRQASKESDLVRKDLCRELNELLSFIESMGKSLQDHYYHIRYICSRQKP